MLCSTEKMLLEFWSVSDVLEILDLNTHFLNKTLFLLIPMTFSVLGCNLFMFLDLMVEICVVYLNDK